MASHGSGMIAKIHGSTPLTATMRSAWCVVVTKSASSQSKTPTPKQSRLGKMGSCNTDSVIIAIGETGLSNLSRHGVAFHPATAANRNPSRNPSASHWGRRMCRRGVCLECQMILAGCWPMRFLVAPSELAESHLHLIVLCNTDG